MNILITGVSKGLGLHLSKIFISEGHHVWGISRTKSSELEALLQNYPTKLNWLAYDLEDSQGIKESVFYSWIGFDTIIHGFVNNAAIAYDDLITNIKLDSLERMYRANVFSPMILTKYTIRQMLLHNISGSIVHLSSISVHTGYKGLSMYASTKGALEAFSKNTAREWGELGIRSNCLVAGFMETDMSSTLNKVQKNRIFNRTSLKKATNITSVADTILFLLTEKALSITGQNIHVDSGTI